MAQQIGSLTYRWFDELSKINSPPIAPIAIPCRYCGAAAGEGCTRQRRKLTYPRKRPHPDRYYDAAQATKAMRALID